MKLIDSTFSRELFFVAVLSCTVLVQSCEEPVEVEDGVGLIVPGRSIDGIKLGDSKETVEAKLGKAESGGIVDGLYRSWYAAEYVQGPHAGLTVYYVEINNQPGPVDELTVMSPYAGRTKEGIGINSALKMVHQVYGIPKKTPTRAEDAWIADFYCFGGKKLEIHYKDSLVTTMSIGYFLPMTQDTSFPCE